MPFRRRIDRRRTEPILVQGPAALQRAVSHHDVVLLASGKVIERKRILRRRHHAQIALNAGTQPHARLGRALQNDRLHQRMRGKRLRDRVRRFGRDDEIEIAHDFFPPPITPRDANMQRIVERAQIVAQGLRFRRDRAERERARVLRRDPRWRAASFSCVVLPKPGNCATRSSAQACCNCAIELTCSCSCSALIFFAPKPGIENSSRISGGNCARSSSKTCDDAGLDQILDHARDRFADPRNFREHEFVAQFGDVAAPGLERARGVRVGANLERILALQFQQSRDLLQRLDDSGFLHAETVTRESARVDHGR